MSKAAEITTSLNTTMKKMRKRVTFKGAPNNGGSKTNSAFNVASLRASLLALDKPVATIRPYFKKASNKLFPGKTKAPRPSPVSSNETSPRSRIQEVDEKIQNPHFLFSPGEWLCDRCGWKAYNKHWCSRLTDEDKLLLQRSRSMELQENSATEIEDKLATLSMEWKNCDFRDSHAKLANIITSIPSIEKFSLCSLAHKLFQHYSTRNIFLHQYTASLTDCKLQFTRQHSIILLPHFTDLTEPYYLNPGWKPAYH